MFRHLGQTDAKSRILRLSLCRLLGKEYDPDSTPPDQSKKDIFKKSFPITVFMKWVRKREAKWRQ